MSASPDALRRLVLLKQGLGNALPRKPSKESITSVVRNLAYVQWDPVPIVAPSHILSLWARLGDFRLSDLEDLLWRERKLVQHWIPFAAIVLAEDQPLYGSFMRRYPESLSRSWGKQRDQARRFLDSHGELRRKILRQLRGGPLTVSQFEDHPRTARNEGDWGSASDVSLMLYHLLMKGEVMVVGHEGAQNVWGLTGQFLPGWGDSHVLSLADAESSAAERAILALGTATRREVHLHFLRGCYSDLPGALGRLVDAGRIRRVSVSGGSGRQEEQYIHERDVSVLESLDSTPPEPRVSLLPPFDNLVYSQTRLRRLFDFDYVREQFFPKEKRRFGTYVLPILWGDRFVGRIDPRLDRSGGKLVINAVHAEASAPTDREVAQGIAGKISELATFLGVDDVVYSQRVPASWRGALR